MTWNSLVASYHRKSTKAAAIPVYGIMNTYNGKLLDKHFDTCAEARAHIKQQRLSRLFKVTVVGKRVRG